MKVLLLLFSLSLLNLNTCQSGAGGHVVEEVMQQQEVIDLVKKNELKAVANALEKGANVDTQDQHKRSLLLIATINEQTDMAKLLVAHGADVNRQDDRLDSPFLYAGASGQTELVKLFLANGARFDVFNRYHGTALIPACERGHVGTVKVLVQTKGFPVDHVNRLGWTGLMEAIVLGDGSEKYQQIVQILKDGGADLRIPDHDGITPLQHARTRGFKEIVKILEE
ncbi:MAG TPA: ankyrin repeat domain-containing protein [Pontibacter sp.]